MTVLFADDWGPDQRDRAVDRWPVCLKCSTGLSECGHLTGKPLAGYSSQVDNQQRHLLRFPYNAICRQKKTSTLDPSGAGSQSLRVSLPKRFWPLIGAHVALLNGSQIVRNRRCWVCSKASYPSRAPVAPEVQSLYVLMAGVRHKSSTLFQSEISRDRVPEALGAIHL